MRADRMFVSVLVLAAAALTTSVAEARRKPRFGKRPAITKDQYLTAMNRALDDRAAALPPAPADVRPRVHANLFLARRVVGAPFHIGVLMDNLPAFVFAELGCALAGAALVGLNPTRTGAALARDIEYADCQLVLTEPRYAEQLHEAIGSTPLAVLVADGGDARWPSLDDALAAVSDTDQRATSLMACDANCTARDAGFRRAPSQSGQAASATPSTSGSSDGKLCSRPRSSSPRTESS